MAVVPTVEIRSPKNPEDKWIINLANFDPSIHTRWGEPVPSEASAQPEADVSEPKPEPEQSEPEHEHNPSVEDFEQDEDGTEWVNIINPDNHRAKLRIPVDEYDPDEHRVWSSHPRFQR